MNLGGSNRQLAIVAALIVLVVAAGLAVALGGDDETPPPVAGTPTAPPATAPPTQPATTPTQPQTQPATVPEPGAEKKAQREQARDARRIEATVRTLIESAEQTDAARFCPLVGLEAQGKGLQQVQRCAAKIDLDITSLPSSDELSFDRVTVADERGSAHLTGGTRVTLRKAGGKWQVTAVRTTTGGATAP